MKNTIHSDSNMDLILYCPIWGMENFKIREALAKIKEAGYHGAEIALNPEKDDLKAIKKTFKDFELRMIAQHPFASGHSPAHFCRDYIKKLQQIADINPGKINCHTGKDYYSVDDNLKIIEAAEEIAVKTGIEIIHEIHRGRFSFSSALIREYISRIPQIKLTADFSHWCVVSESLLEDQEDTIRGTVQNCHHIHARVGAGETPQVTHPAAPENQYALQRHTHWWKLIYDQHKKRNQKELTITCEFGPVPYLPVLPFTNQPVASQWEINLFMKDYLTQKFKQWNQKKN